MTYTIYGNCQADSLAKILNTNNEFTKIYKYIPVKAVHEINSLEEIKYLNREVFPKLDLFIFIPIINFPEEFTTDYILNKVLNKKTIVIYFQTIYADIYFPQIKKIKNYITDSQEYYDINSSEIEYSEEFLNENLEKNIKNLKDRELFHPRIDKKILIHEFIRKNYNKKCLFYTIDHGSKYIYQYIAKKILKYLNMNNRIIDENLDPQYGFTLPMYKSVSKWCNIETSDYQIKSKAIIAKKYKLFSNIEYPPGNDDYFEVIIYLSKELDINLLYQSISCRIKSKVPIIGIFVNEYIKIKNDLFDQVYILKNEYEAEFNIPLIINREHIFKNLKLCEDIHNLIINNENIANQIENTFLGKNNTDYRYGILESLNKTLFQNIHYFLTNI